MPKVTDKNGVEISYPADTYPALPNNDIEAHIKQLEGRILTLIDAVMPEPQQNKATKDIVRGQFKAKIHDIYTDSNLYTGTKYNGEYFKNIPLGPGHPNSYINTAGGAEPTKFTSAI